MWQAEWQVVENHEQRAGGQATVLKVTRRSDGVLGALKRLHPQHLNSTERRFRMQQEANALIALSGKGAPQLLASNVESWIEPGEPLYIVMEWIEGPTLADACSKKKFNIEQTLSVALAVLDTIGLCHELPLYHRDLKPDNVILLGGSYENPVLVDFGMAWARPDEDQTRRYHTPVGQELANRFLRLPEFAPGRDARDPRSDLSMVVGLLFYMLTNLAPRALDDGRGRMPHEAFEDSFPEAVRQDTRWVRLRRIFNIGFQGSLDLRFQNAEQLRSRLLNLEPPEGGNEEQKLQEELAAIADVMNSAAARSVAVGATIISQAAERFMTAFRRALKGSGFTYGGSGPNLTAGGKRGEFYFFLVRQSTSEPQAMFRHLTAIEGSKVSARVQIEAEDWEEYYSGPISDPEGLGEAMEARALVTVRQLLGVMKLKLAALYGRQ